MRRSQTAPPKRETIPAQRAQKRVATPAAADKERMVHIRLEPELHRKIRLIVAAEDTTLQEWIARTLEEAATKAKSSIKNEGER
jgi:predicted HicB family RNase H-like nuclease